MKAWILGIMRTVHPLNGEAETVQVPIAADMDTFQMTQQRGPGIPWHVQRGNYDVVAVEGGERDEFDVFDIAPRSHSPGPSC